jgi:UDP-N-acetylmuramate-alanine ligase
MQDAIEFLLREARPGDALMTIGAGNVSRASNELMVLLGTELRVEEKPRHAD